MKIRVINGCNEIQSKLVELASVYHYDLVPIDLQASFTTVQYLSNLDPNLQFVVIVPASFYKLSTNDSFLAKKGVSWVIADNQEAINSNPHISELITNQKLSGVLYLPAAEIDIRLMIQQVKKDFNKSTQIEKLYSQFLHQQEHLRKLTNIGIALSNEDDIETLLDSILDIALEITDSDSGTLYFIERNHQPGSDEPKKLRFIHTKNNSLNIPFQNSVVDVSNDSISGFCALSGKTLNIQDVTQIKPGDAYKFNDKFDQLIGYSSKSMLVTPLKNYQKEIIGVLQLINKKKNAATVLSSQEIVNNEVLSFTDFDINLIESFGSQAAIAVENKNLVAGIKFQLDQVKKAQEEKMNALVTLVAGIAHEVNNPVNFISSSIIPLQQYLSDIKLLMEPMISIKSLDEKAFSELIENSHNESLTELLTRLKSVNQGDDDMSVLTEIDELLKGIESGSSRISDIVRSLRAFSLLENPEFNYVEPNKIVEAAVKSARKEHKKQVNIIAHLGTLPKIMGNTDLLHMGLIHILDNAFQAVDENGTIVITTESKGDHVVVSVEDDGHGIPDDIQSKIFDPFFTTRPIGKGLGLGLSVSFSVIQKHNGGIFHIPVSKRGTRFDIHLPLHQ